MVSKHNSFIYLYQSKSTDFKSFVLIIKYCKGEVAACIQVFLCTSYAYVQCKYLDIHAQTKWRGSQLIVPYLCAAQHRLPLMLRGCGARGWTHELNHLGLTQTRRALGQGSSETVLMNTGASLQMKCRDRLGAGRHRWQRTQPGGWTLITRYTRECQVCSVLSSLAASHAWEVNGWAVDELSVLVTTLWGGRESGLLSCK